MSVYFIATLNIHNAALYQQYLQELAPIFAKYNGEYLASDANPEILEGNRPCNRVVLLRFPDQQSLKKWYHSEDYQRVLTLREQSADSEVVVIEG